MYRPRDRLEELTPEQRQRLSAGRHESVARELSGAGNHAAAGWVLEQIWDFEGAYAAYLAADLGLDAVRVALELRDPTALSRALTALSRASDGQRREAAELLTRRGRHLEAAALLPPQPADIDARALALQRGGDPLAAAELLVDSGRPQRALVLLQPLLDGRVHAAAHALAARIGASLGDLEAAVRHAQIALRAGYDRPDRPELHRVLAHALAALGHDLAAQIALASVDDDGITEAATPGRYHVRRTLSACFAGAAYAGVDRVTLQEVEIHLLLADLQEGAIGPELQAALTRFAQRAEAAARLGHPAIRPILRLDVEAGLLVLPRAEGAALSAQLQPPGRSLTPTRARALIAFLLEGLEAAHQRGLVHGSILPSQIATDAAGRPLLGPFGADHLAGLTATRTGALEEVLVLTAPERRLGAPATVASDIYSVAAIFAALLSGEIGGDLARLSPRDRALIDDALSPDPGARPDATALLRRLRGYAADPRDLRGGPAADPNALADERLRGAADLIVLAAETWPLGHLEELSAADHPWIQPILDRDGRRLALAPWPAHCERARPHDHPVLPAEAEERLTPALRAAISARLSADAWVKAPGGAWMLALDRLLTR
ncbi:MAG: hypothetical protein IPK80_22560 [Nannocystis sp.]|nr:hypothetical protein [Nannocystis sp.]